MNTCEYGIKRQGRSPNHPLHPAPLSPLTMSLNDYPLGTPTGSTLPPLPHGWGSSPPQNSDFLRLPPLSSQSDGWGPSPARNFNSPAFHHQHTPSPATHVEGLGSERHSHSISSTPSPPVTPSPTPIIKPLFIDTLARDMKLEDGQKQSLHDFVLVRALNFVTSSVSNVL